MVDVIRATSVLHRLHRNLLLDPNKFDTTWTGTATAVQSASLGPFGDELAWDLTDNSNVAFQSKVQTIAVNRDFRNYAYSLFVKKTTGGTAPAMGCAWNFTGGVVVTGGQNTPRLNPDTGTTLNGGAPHVEDYGDWWRIWNVIQNQGSSNVLTFTIFPAVGVQPLVSDSSATQGTTTVFGAMVNVGNRAEPYYPPA